MKKTWVNTKIFGKDFWFMTHQLSMCTTWVLTLAGFIIILIDSNRWSTNPHSVMGTITFCLCFVQPIGAVFRPGPKDLTRPVFNFLHLSAGNFAHLLAGKFQFCCILKSLATFLSIFSFHDVLFRQLSSFWTTRHFHLRANRIRCFLRDILRCDDGEFSICANNPFSQCTIRKSFQFC